MPVARYFFCVGAVLLALLLASNAYLPSVPMPASLDMGVDKSVIRIHSDRKWPERIVFDTQQPTITPSLAANNVAPALPAPTTLAESKARARDSYAELQSSDQKNEQLSEPKKLEKKTVRKRRIVKRRTPPPVMLAAQRPQFGFFGMTW
ncbi:MAG TPA: hypothetical protein VHM22_13000 [Bradyrhizobium sp.]|jgi:hypothetical protein|nr:hypothetical protein [Bradyrhizobium sp.]